MFKKSIFLLLIAIFLNACTAGKIVQVDPKTGYFPSSTKAKVVMSKAIDLDGRKSLILIPNGEFERGQITNMHYFDEIMNFKDLETRIIQANLSEKVPTVSERIGVNNAAKFYKPFLWFRFERTRERGETPVARFLLTDPITMEDLFVTETEMDYAWKGVNDQYNWYPMFNAFLDYIKANSKTYKPSAQ